MKLGDCLKLNKTSKISISDGKKYLISGVQNYGQGIVVRKEVFGSELNMKTYQSISENQLMWCKVDTKNGAFGLTKTEHIDTLASTNMALADIDTSKIDAEFLEILFRQKPFADYITKLSSGSTNRKYLTPKQLFATVKIPDLNLKEQVEFVKRVKRIESVKIEEEIQTQKQLISKLKQAILQEAIQGKLTEDWRTHRQAQDDQIEPASELLERIKAEKAKLIKEEKIKKEKPLPKISKEEIPFELPENWVWCRLGEISLNSMAGKSYKAIDFAADENEYGVVKTSSITSGIFKESENKLLPNQSIDYRKILIKSGDLLFCRASGSKGLAGKSCIVTQEPKAKLILSDKTVRYWLSSFVNIEYVHLFNSSRCALNYYQSLGTDKSTTMNNVTRPQFNCLALPLPPIKEQKAIVEKVESLMQKCDVLELEIQRSEQHANMLMQAVLKEAFETKEMV